MGTIKTDAISRDWQRLGPLRADLFLAFAEKAMVLLSKTDPSLAPEAIKDDRERIPMLARVVAAIPELASVKPSRYFPYDRYDFAELMMRSRWAKTEERTALEPLFMFVYGMSFKEMDAKKPPSGLFGRRIVMKERRPWVSEDVKKGWREPVKRGRRSGGRNGRSGG
ncbi:MAG: hypothetical protein Q9207_007183 [Kuettlingeria erythrocarpa]